MSMISEATYPVISVIMGVHNERYPDAISKAVDSILSQSYPNIELIICDDGSDSEVSEKLEALCDSDEHITLIRNEEQKGLAYSLNRCMDIATGVYIARMDADDISYPERLKREYEYLESHPDIGWTGCNAEVFDQNGKWGRSVRPVFPGKADYLKYSPFIHPSVLFRAQIIKEAGGYSEDEEFMLSEDYELFLRLRDKGYAGHNLQEELLMYFCGRDDYHVRSISDRYAEFRMRFKVFRRYGLIFPTGWLYGLRPLVAGLIPSGLIRSVKKRKNIL